MRGLRRLIVSVLAAVALASPVLAVPAQAADPSQVGQWGAPFAEPTINGEATDEYCVEESQEGDDHDGKHVTCKPTAGSMAILGGDDVVYWDALEDTEEV
ncbi:MAG TPA: hypothetical protein VI916_14700, partial [Acidimicrobiia bacterium]|nr:hypothetical protein [Acidimicrobiia bacterium]